MAGTVNLSAGDAGHLPVNLRQNRRRRELGLKDRQIEAMTFVRERGSISNKEYRELCEVSRQTAHEDLRKMVALDLLVANGTTGRALTYRVRTGHGQ